LKRLLHSRFVDRALRGAALVVTDRRWAAPLSAAALGLGIFAGVAIGPGAAGSLAGGAQRIIELPESGGEEGQSGGGGSGVASTESVAPLGGGEAGGFEEAFPTSAPPAPEPLEPVATPVSEPATKPTRPASEEEGEPEETEAQALTGTVVHTNPAAGSYAVAIEGGELVSIHAPKLPEPGSKLDRSFRRLANGTFAEVGDRKGENAKTADATSSDPLATKATFRGVVTWTSPDVPRVEYPCCPPTPGTSPAYTLSGHGVSLLVHVNPGPTGTTPELPAIGAYATVTATFKQTDDPQALPTLTETKRELEPGPPSTYLDLAGIFQEVEPNTNQLLLSADDTDESNADLALTIPSSIDPVKLKPGDSYLATATINPDGTLQLSGITSDEHSKGANDPASAQGDLKR
jgi:hypothetical protein